VTRGKKTTGRIGTYAVTSAAGKKIRAYIPRPLPPEPAIELDKIYQELEAANRALGRLDGVTSVLPATHLFLYMYVRKEAVLSAQIEGTQSSLSDLLLYESDAAPGVPLDDVREVSNYVLAMDLGIQRLREGLPLSNRLVRELHSVLLRGVRGSSRGPGQFRRSQNWIGGTRPGNALFVPPPPSHVPECMGDLELRWSTFSLRRSIRSWMATADWAGY
jgi:Fic family protein